MLDKAVSSYQEAYGKINSIIKNTGWVGSTDFNNTQSDLSTETGVKNQNSNDHSLSPVQIKIHPVPHLVQKLIQSTVIQK